MNKKEAYDFLYRLGEGIADMFGECCETLIQENVKDEIVTIAIFNGHVSGREANSKIGILGGVMDPEKLNYEEFMVDNRNQLVIHPSGKKIKSSSFVMKGDDYTYIFGINYDVTALDKVQGILNGFMDFEGELYETLKKTQARSLDSVYDSCARLMPTPQGKMSKDNRFTLIKLLNEQNYFELQKSIPFLAGKLGVSKYTLYKDLDQLNLH